MLLSQSVENLPRTSAVTIKRLKSLGILTYYDLLNYFPFRYEDYSLVSKINKIQEGEIVTVKGQVEEAKNVYTRKGITLQKVLLNDGTGKVELVWFNQPYLAEQLKKSKYISVAGQVKKNVNHFAVETKEYEILSSLEQITVHTGKIVPIYPEIRGISTKTIRDKVNSVINSMDEPIDWLPKEIIDYNNLIDENEAYKQIHFPNNFSWAEKARKRLSFDELFTIQLSTSLIKKEWKKEQATNKLILDKNNLTKLQTFVNDLPFKLTPAQNKVYNEILTDLKQENPMNRFVQGDVGSGKTVVAAIACYAVFLNGFQSLIMAPTEILTQQHFNTISKLFKKYGLKVGIQTGSKKIKKEELSKYDIIVGTQALLNKSLEFKKVGFVVIDEQHRFGVAQRALLKQKGINPHLLTMTATPIPRTVALTLYGELDLSVIDEMPAGRIPIKTYLVSKHKRSDAYRWIEKEIKTKGCQVFIICPLIEESEIETMTSVKAAKKEYENLKNQVFKDLKVCLLHGKMKSSEKEEIMTDFKNKKYDVLVSTSVVEVGIDIPNATIMVIEGAERYGLAQLHQLRGRVGRGQDQSYCLLFTSDHENPNSGRLKFFAINTSGLKIAEFDFKIRGPGQIYGIKQHGYLDLKIADLSDLKLVEQSRNAVYYFLNHYKLHEFPIIKDKVKKFQINQISRD